MLRKHNSKSKSDVRHRTSASSPRSVPLEHISVAVAQRDAKVAAVQAFCRGQDRQAAHMALFPAQESSPHRKENSSPARLLRHDSVASMNSEHDKQTLGRRQSVRFVGPDYGLQTRASKISMRATPRGEDAVSQHHPLNRSKSAHNVNPLGNIFLGTQNTQLPDRTSSHGKTPVTPTPTHEQDYYYHTALAPDTQLYTPEDDIASIPSSYRRLRKTRSMFTSRSSARSSHDGHMGDPLTCTEEINKTVPTMPRSRFSFLNRKDGNPILPTAVARAPKSMSFLRHRYDRPTSSVTNQDLAQNNLPNLECSSLQERSLHSRLLSKPPIFFGPKGTKAGQGMRKPLRQRSSSAILHISETTASIPLNIHGSIRIKAHRVSSSIKSRLKNLFINRSEDDAELPAQQITSQRTHVPDFLDHSQLGPVTSESGGFPERSSLSKIPSRVPSLHTVSSSELLRSQQGSIDSCKSGNMRVSDEKSRVTSWASTETNTVITHRPQVNSEEWDKQRLSIISEHENHASSPFLNHPWCQTDISQKPTSPNNPKCLPPRTTIDSQRVYSALMKRMGEKGQTSDHIPQQRKSSDSSDPFRTLSPPNSEDSQCTDPGVYPSLSPPPQSTPKGTGLPASKPITDRSSVFFGSPTSHLFRTRSPWRRSIQEAIQKEHISSQDPVVDITASVITGTEADSASTYSQESQIHKPEMCQEFPISGHIRSPNSQEEATLLISTPSYHPTGERLVSTTSSVGWKTQLSYDVAKMEESAHSPTKVSGRPSEVEYVVPTMPRAFGHGHVREEAQIGSYEEDQYNTSPVVHMPTNSTTPLDSVEPNAVRLTPQQRSVMQRTPPPALTVQETTTSAVVVDEERGYFHVPRDATKSTASPWNNRESQHNTNPTSVSYPQIPTHEADFARQSKSLAQVQNFFRVGTEETGSPRPLGSPTVRLMRKTAPRLEPNSASTLSTPCFSTAFERQFGSLPRRLGGELVEKENKSPHDDGHEGMIRSRSPITKTNRKGGKTIVELFLNGRGRQGTGSDGEAFI